MTTTETLSRFMPLADELHTVAQRLRSTVVTIRIGREGSGSGVIWPSQGLIITNNHVARTDRVDVVFPDGELAGGEVIGRDQENDLAALAVERPGQIAAPVADSGQVRVGQLVIAMGHPLGVEHALTIGIVSGLPEPDDPRDMIRADILLNPGNSGGPLADVQGRIIGINAMVVGPGVALAVPSHVVVAFLARASGKAGYLGIELQPVRLPALYLRRFGLPVGIMVTGLLRGGPAQQAGVLPGDIIFGVAGRALLNPYQLRDRVALVDPGHDLALTVIRGGERHEIVVKVGRRG
jgi:serine protease Do